MHRTVARATVIVMDACGVGALPDAERYGDAGTNTLGHLADLAGGLDLPTLQALGLGSILPLRGVAPAADPVLHGRVGAQGPGKESTTGHWELMGVIPAQELPTYPDGFPDEVVRDLERATGLSFCVNAPYSGTVVLDDYAEHHLRTGEVILYTSADSVLQLAAHVDVLSEQELVAACRQAREVMRGEHAVGRVIARPFDGGRAGTGWRRLPGRRDFALEPPGPSYLQALQQAGVPVHGVGKIHDLFAGVGVDVKHPGATNAEAIASTTALLDELPAGFIFVNLVETDQLYGHRHDVPGFAAALGRIDAAVAQWLPSLRDDDLFVLTADHGVDPATGHTDHTREYAPLLARFAGDAGRRRDGQLADVGASVLAWLTGDRGAPLPGTPFV
jgi:phosphopentomutase